MSKFQNLLRKGLRILESRAFWTTVQLFERWIRSTKSGREYNRAMRHLANTVELVHGEWTSLCNKLDQHVSAWPNGNRPSAALNDNRPWKAGLNPNRPPRANDGSFRLRNGAKFRSW